MSRVDEAASTAAGERTAALPPQLPAAGHLDGLFGSLGIRSRIALGQLPLTVTVMLVAVAAAVFSPATLADNAFQLALLAHAVLFASCLALPWDRLPPGSFAVIPALDCFAIGFTREAGGPAFNVMSLMLVFPVVWLSAQPRRYMLVMAILAAVTTAFIPFLMAGAPPPRDSMIRVIVLPLMMSAIAVTAHLVSGTLRRQRQELVDNEHALAEALDASVHKQRLLDAVLGAVGMGVLVVDRTGRTVLANKALLADPALARLLEPSGSHGLLLPDKATPVPAELSPLARAAAGTNFVDELFWAGPPGQLNAYSVSSHGMPESDGKERGSVLTFVDVTALTRALAAKDDFVGTVSHELRTPLTSILGYLELVLDEPGHEEIREELLVVRRNAEHLLSLVKDLIAVASDRVDLRLEETDLAQLVAEVVDSAVPKASQKGLELVLDVEQPLPARVDPDRIRQVVRNLLSNAIKYSPNGGRITARARKTGGQLICSITDPGLGMSEEEQEQAFTKFFRSARSRETAIPGAGLGLPVSKTILEGHGGTITLTSAPGKGTSAEFTLPSP